MSLRTLIARHIQGAAGTYAPNHFLLTLDSGTPFITGPDDNPTADTQFFHIFFHEYWHYLQNVTTVSGFKSFAFTQHLLPPFSKTLLKRADGTGEGAAALTAEERTNVKTLLELQRDLDGDDAPTSELSGDWDVDFRVVGIGRSQTPYKYFNQNVPNPIITLDVECTWPNGHNSRAKLRLGACAIEESVAFLAEEQVRQSSPHIPFDPPPAFPYRVVEKTLDFILGSTTSSFVAAALGTLALLTTHPGPGLIQLANAFRNEMRSGKDIDSALDTVVQVHRQSVILLISTILDHDLPSLQRMHGGRGLMEGALAHIGSIMRRALSRRLTDPLFDVNSVFPVATNGALVSLQNNFPSCDLVQERVAHPSVFPRDLIYCFDPSGEDMYGNMPSVYTRSLQAQQDFVLSHLDKNGSFLPSDQCESRCPYFDSCHLPLRKEHPGLCENKPWFAHYHPDGACWYATGVAATLGPVRIRRSTSPASHANPKFNRVQERAYQLWEARGRPLGDDWVDWFHAENELSDSDS